MLRRIRQRTAATRAGLPAEARRAKAGFTLVEMLVSMALLVIFGTVAIKALQYGSSLWRVGHRRAFAYDAATIVFEQIADDVTASRSLFWNKDAEAYDPRVKFWLDFDQYGRQRVRFVRAIADEVLNPYLREAGTDSTYTGVYNLIDFSDPLQPLEGMCEVAYLRGLDPEDADTLYRAVLSPIGDDTGAVDDPDYTFFHGDTDPLQDTFGTPERIHGDATVQAKATPLAENLLHFEVRCWTQYATTWQDPVDVWTDPYAWSDRYVPEVRGPVLTWDSDRLQDGATPWTPSFRMDWNQTDFPDPDDYATNEDKVEDNVFPAAIMVVVVTVPPDNLRRVGAVRLAQNITDTDLTIRITGTQPKINERWPYIRIEDEWIRFDSFDPDTQTFTVAAGDRGVRGTTASPHSATPENPVEFGYTFSRVFRNPAARAYW